MLAADIHRCIGIGTAEGQPNAEFLDCARRQQGIADYMAGTQGWWMAPPTETPCPERLTEKK